MTIHRIDFALDLLGPVSRLSGAVARFCPRDRTVQGEACAVVATLSSPGQSATRLVPWVGGAEVKGGEAPFREPPESYVKVTEFAKCADLRKALADNAPLGDDGAVSKAVAATKK